MKLLLISLIGLVTLPLQAEPLKPEEKNHVVDTLKELLSEARREQVKHSLEVYEKLEIATQKDVTAMALFYEAVKQVNFIDKDKKSTDFLSWKNKKRSEFSRLRYRGWMNFKLRWLMLSIKAFNSEGDIDIKYDFQEELLTYLDDFYTKLEDILPEKEGTEKEKTEGLDEESEEKPKKKTYVDVDLLQSEVSKFLGLSELKIKGWPKNPLELNALYDEFILPYYREEGDVEGLRNLWEKRLAYEEMAIIAKDSENKKGLRSSGRERETKAMVKFLEEKRPELVWEMHMDCFNSGDNRHSAAQMLEHITEHSEHAKVKEWAKELLLGVAPEEAEEE